MWRRSRIVCGKLILFVFDTFDFLALEVFDILKRVQMVMYNNISLLGFHGCSVIQKGL